jgi:hypothetical protein
MKNENETRLLVLDPKHGDILSFDTEGKDKKFVLQGIAAPDGIVIDVANSHIYWTNMGFRTPDTERFEKNDGTIERCDLDGGNRKTIIPPGKTFTPKQLALDLKNGKIYWCDREGMRVMCANLDGSAITTLVKRGNVETDEGDELRRCVGITLDIKNGYIYWTQKGPHNGGQGRIFRAGLNLPANASPENRDDIELLWDNLPEPIDLELDEENATLYWTDRGLPPNGNTLNMAVVSREAFCAPVILCSGLKGAIGLALDRKNRRVFLTDIGGNLYAVGSNGENFQLLYTGDHMLTGIAFLPAN